MNDPEGSGNVDFPVEWPRPGDSRWLWSQDRGHYPDPITPLEFALIESCVDAGFTLGLQFYGAPVRVHDRHINTFLYTTFERLPREYEEAQRLRQESNLLLRETMGNLEALWETSWLPEIQAHLSWWSGFDRQAASTSELLTHLCETARRWKRVWEVHFLVTVPSKLAICEFARLYRDVIDDAGPVEPYTLLAGLETKTVESGRALWALSRKILASHAVMEAFRLYAVGEVIGRLRLFPDGRLFLAELDQYLAVFGERADKLSLHDPFWVDDPSPVIASLQNYIQEPDRNLEVEMARVVRTREEQVDKFRAKLANYPRAARFEAERLLRAAQAGAFLGEEHGYWIDTKASYAVRRVVLAIGQRLATEGVLSDNRDVFYLDLPELKELLGSEDRVALFDRSYADLVANRREFAGRFSRTDPPEFLGAPAGGSDDLADEGPVMELFFKLDGDGPVDRSTSNLIVGVGASAGVVCGTVRILRGLSEAAKLIPGEILVAQTTAPPWTPLFASIAGLVTNSGGILSHSAVVAREYGLPAVVGTHTATERLHDGQLVEVDGGLGTVTILTE